MADHALARSSWRPAGVRIDRTELGWIAIAVTTAALIALTDARTALTLSLATVVAVASFPAPSFGLAVLVATVPVQDEWPARLGALEVTWTRVALVAVGGAWLVRLLMNGARIRLTAIAYGMLAYCCALVLSIVHARNIEAWAAESYRWFVATAVLIIATSIVHTERDRRRVIAGLAAGVLFSFAIATYQIVTGSGPETFNQRGVLRAYGLFGEPNPFAGYLEIATLPLLAIGLATLLHDRGNERRATGVAITLAGIVGCVTLAMTQSRGGLLGFAAGVAVICWFLWPGVGRKLVAGLMGIGLVLIWIPPASPIRTAFGLDGLLSGDPVQVTTANWAAQERLAHWGGALRMWEDQPWLGIGAGNFSDRFREFTPVWRFRISRGHAHSAYLQAASQAGAVGLACFVALLLAAWHTGVRRRPGATRGGRVAVAAVTAAIAVHGIFDYLHVLSIGIALSAVWAIGSTEEVAKLSEPVRMATIDQRREEKSIRLGMRDSL